MNMKNVTILDHPLIQHKISLLRNKNTGTNEFRSLTDEIAMLMGYEALRDLPLEDQHDDLPVRGVHLLAHRTVRGRCAALRPALCAHPSLPALRGVKGWSMRSR